MNEPQRPYYDKDALARRRAERIAQLKREVKRAFGFGKCKIIKNDEQGYKKE